jgi:hypothetical protein
MSSAAIGEAYSSGRAELVILLFFPTGLGGRYSQDKDRAIPILVTKVIITSREVLRAPSK